MKSSISNQVRSYLSVSTSFLLCAGAQGQISHTNYSPDISLSDLSNDDNFQVTPINIDGQGVREFEIEIKEKFNFSTIGTMNVSSLEQLVYFNPVTSNALPNYVAVNSFSLANAMGTSSSPSPSPVVFNKGDLIGSSMNWDSNKGNVMHIQDFLYITGGLPITEPKRTGGNWSDIQDGYLGLKFSDAGNLHYGWLRVGVDSTRENLSITVKEWAYKESPDEPIVAGDTIEVFQGTGISESQSEALKIWNTPSSLLVNNPGSRGRVLLLNLNGQTVLDFHLDSGKNQKQIDHLPSGVYLVQVRRENGITSKKIILR